MSATPILDITTPPFSHGQLYAALSRVRDCNNIVMYLTEEQLMINHSHPTDFMPTSIILFIKMYWFITAKYMFTQFGLSVSLVATITFF